MRSLSTSLSDILNQSGYFLALCIIITEEDGTKRGLTNHDKTLICQNTSCSPCSIQQDVSIIKTSAGFGKEETHLSLSGAETIFSQENRWQERWRGAKISFFLKEWNSLSEDTSLWEGYIDAMSVDADTINLILVPVLTLCNRRMAGRMTTSFCDAVLGDMRCGIPIQQEPWQSHETIQMIQDSKHIMTSLTLVLPVNEWFSGGHISFLSGTMRGLKRSIYSAMPLGTGLSITLWEDIPPALSVGTEILLVTGCNKTATTCRTKFNNLTRFRGFPEKPFDASQ